jgi:hypothetical protein
MPRGFSGVRTASADLEARRQSGGPNALWFRLDPDEEAIVRFLEQGEDIFWCYMHEVPVEGRNFGRDVVCINQEEDGTPCPGCEQGLPRRFKGFINLIWDHAPVFKKDAEGKLIKGDDKKPIITGYKPQVAVWGSGIRLFEELEEIDSTYRGLKSRRFKVKRKGSGLNTKYSIKPAEIDSGPQDFDSSEKELAEKKYDLNDFVKPPSYNDFTKELGQSGGSGGSNGSGGSDGPPKPKNPFMRRTEA